MAKFILPAVAVLVALCLLLVFTLNEHAPRKASISSTEDVAENSPGVIAPRVESQAPAKTPAPADAERAEVKVETVRVFGSALNPDGAPVAGAIVIDAAGTEIARCNAAGAFEANVARKPLILLAIAEDFAPEAEHSVDFDSKAEIVLKLKWAIKYSGKVVDDVGAPVPGLELTICDEKKNRYEATTNAEGQFSFEGLRPGAFFMNWVEHEYVIEGFDFSLNAEGPRSPKTIVALRSTIVRGYLRYTGETKKMFRLALRTADGKEADFRYFSHNGKGSFELRVHTEGTFYVVMKAPDGREYRLGQRVFAAGGIVDLDELKFDEVKLDEVDETDEVGESDG